MVSSQRAKRAEEYGADYRRTETKIEIFSAENATFYFCIIWDVLEIAEAILFMICPWANPRLESWASKAEKYRNHFNGF